jgi:thymidylate kinase
MLDGEIPSRHRAAVEQAAADVLAPTLVIWLDAAEDELVARVVGRGREFETSVEPSFLGALREGYSCLLNGPAAPPLYRPDATTPEELVRELLVVAHAMQGVNWLHAADS